MKKSQKLFLLLIFTTFILGSCLGAKADITMRSDGSGRLVLEYRVSQMLEAMGRLDGNEQSPAIPVGKADLEQSVARIPGLRLSSFSAKNAPHRSGGNDLVTTATIEFANTQALVAFLDSAGNKATLLQRDGKNVLRLVLQEPNNAIGADMLPLLQHIAAGYEIGFSLSAPQNATLTVIPQSVTAARVVTQGKKVSFAIDLKDLLDLQDGLAIEMVW